MGKMPSEQRGKEWGSCHLSREERNGEDVTCAERKRMGKMPRVQGGREWGRCHVCREKKMGKMSRVQGGREWGRCHVCREEEPCTSEAQRKAKMENKY